ncbi:MAG: archaeosortase/exosortase family protein [Phycisphaerae bacterium]
MLHFLLWFIAFHAFYYAPTSPDSARERTTRALLRGYATGAASFLRLFDQEVTAIDRTVSGRVQLQIARNCDAIQSKIVVLSAILAFPASWLRKLSGLLACLAAIALLNLLRIVTLYWLLRDWPDWFEFVHLKVWQPVMVGAAIVLFVCWTRYALRTQQPVETT